MPLQAIINAPGESQVNQSITFDGSGSSSSAEITTYQWDFGDGVSGEGVAVEHTYEAAGVYDVILTIEDADGQIASGDMQISIQANLVGPVWVLEGTEITLIFGEGMLSGNAGCNDYSAGYTTTVAAGNANDISVDLITKARQACEESVMNQEGAFLTRLQSASRYTISGSSLTFTTADGELIFYAAAPST